MQEELNSSLCSLTTNFKQNAKKNPILFLTAKTKAMKWFLSVTHKKKVKTQPNTIFNYSFLQKENQSQKII